MDVVDDDNNNKNPEKQDSAKTTNESLSFLSSTKVIRIEDPVEFRRTMPLYVSHVPPNAPVTVVEVRVSRNKKSDRIDDTTPPAAKKYNPTREGIIVINLSIRYHR